MLNLISMLPIRSTTRSLKRVVPYFKEHNIKTVLDYGSGTLRNTNFLIKNGFKVYIFDKKEQLLKISNKPEIEYIDKIITDDDIELLNINVDAVISNFVLNLLSLKDQTSMLKYITKIINNNGYLFIEVKKWNIKDLIGYTEEQQIYLDNLIVPFGFDRIISYKNLYSLSSLYKKNNYNWN